MRELSYRTRRIRRGWLDRLRGFDRLYQTDITDGLERVAYGRGQTREVSEQSALRKWNAKFAQATEVTEYDFQVEVQGDNLTVARPGSGFRAVYFKPAGRPQLILRQRTETEDHELLAQVWQAANAKARELGWIV